MYIHPRNLAMHFIKIEFLVQFKHKNHFTTICNDHFVNGKGVYAKHTIRMQYNAPKPHHTIYDLIIEIL